MLASVLLSTVFCVIGAYTQVAAELIDTPAPVSPIHPDLLKQKRDYRLARKALDDLSFCYGTNAICSYSIDLFDACSDFEFKDDLTPWYQCICGNGYVSTDEACDWCNMAYGISFIDNRALNAEDCSEFGGGTIAPVPASVLSIQSKWNATYTGIISGAPHVRAASTSAASTSAANAGGIGSALGVPTVTSVSSTPRTTRSSIPQSTRSTSHFTSTYSLNGGDSGVVTATPTSNQGGLQTSSPSTTIRSGSGTGGTEGWNTGIATIFAMVAFGVSVLFLV